MAAIKIIPGLVCFIVAGSFSQFNRNMLVKSLHIDVHIRKQELVRRTSMINRANAEVGVREKTGHNDGVRVEEYLASVGLSKGQPYCAAFISWLYQKEGYVQPKSGWCPDLFPNSRLSHLIIPGNVFGIYMEDKKRIAHVGLVEKMDGDWCQGIEANTNINGSREGDGVYRKRRHIKTLYKIADWISNGKRLQ